jgi:hypothetical protein
LYFSTPGALILDNRLANAVHRLSQVPNLVTGNGRSLAWTPYRYSVYLHRMTQTAGAVRAEPELLELTLFQPPGDLNEEAGAETDSLHVNWTRCKYLNRRYTQECGR